MRYLTGLLQSRHLSNCDAEATSTSGPNLNSSSMGRQEQTQFALRFYGTPFLLPILFWTWLEFSSPLNVLFSSNEINS